MADTSTSAERWPDKDGSVWERNAKTGAFSAVSFANSPIHQNLAPAELAAMLGCPSSIDPLDCCPGSDVAWFPLSFKHSPATGKQLTIPNPQVESWLAPFGSQGLTAGIVA